MEPKIDSNENELIIMADDFKHRMAKKNEIISDISKLIFMIYGLVRRGCETDDNAFFEEARGAMSEWFDERFELE